LAVFKALGEDGPGLRVTRRTASSPIPINFWTEIDGAHIDAFGTLANAGLNLNSTSTGNVNLVVGGGNVGIGTTTTGRKLQIGSSTVADSEGMIRLASRSGTQGSNRVWDIGVPETDADSSGFGYSFVIDDTQSGTDPEFMVKFGSGNVGIGTAEPGYRLDVGGRMRVR
jgi:hypothetical protein